MTALDLTVAAPRSGKLAVEGIVFLPRTIDKVRATLEGGNLGAYTIAGFTERMFEMLGLDPAKFTEVVRNARSDSNVVDHVRATAGGEKIAEWNAYVTARAIRDDEHRADLTKRYPVLANHPEATTVLDVLDLDDEAAFASVS